jgi:hypothetical protein
MSSDWVLGNNLKIADELVSTETLFKPSYLMLHTFLHMHICMFEIGSCISHLQIVTYTLESTSFCLKHPPYVYPGGIRSHDPELRGRRQYHKAMPSGLESTSLAFRRIKIFRQR